MRIDCKKRVFVGATSERTAFFREAQNQGIIEFIDATNTKVRETPADIQRLGHAIKVLRGLLPVEQEEVRDWHQVDPIVDRILSFATRIEKLQEDKRIVAQEIARVEVFGDFDMREIAYLKEEADRNVQFFAAKKTVTADLPDQPELLFIDSDHGMDYFVSISQQPRQYEGMIEMRIDQPVGILHKRAADIVREAKICDTELDELAKYSQFLHEALVVKLDAYSLETAQTFVDFKINDQIFAVEGWVPNDKQNELASLLDRCRVHCEEVAIEEKDRKPTALTNMGLARIGEDLVHIYDTPGTEDKDPSTWVLWSFALFFAMILSDGGYGLIFLAVAGFLYFKFPNLSGMGKRVRTLTAILATSCIIWGVLTNSFFGISFDLGSPFRSFSLVQTLSEKKAAYHMGQKDDVYQEWVTKFPEVAKASTPYEFLDTAASLKANGSRSFEALDKFSDNVMLEIALLIGIIHISLSFMRNIGGSWAGLGWIAFMIGAYFNFPSMLNATSMAHYVLGVDKVAGAEAGRELLYGGMGSALVLALIQHKGSGALEIMNLIQVFSDVLSYLRLYALGLAGSMMSATFNQIGGEVTFVAGVLIILLGHTVNIVLSIMGGVIHGLRLNFLEWYHFCFEGGGKMFNPLRRFGVE